MPETLPTDSLPGPTAVPGGEVVLHARCLNPDCDRPLRDPVSRRRGFGRACWEKRRPRPLGEVIRVLPLARRAQQIADGQIAFDEEPADGDL